MPPDWGWASPEVQPAWLWAILLAVQAASAIAVTLHVLLRRRPPPSAAGWIGLAWLAPLVGAALYAAIGINRIERRALRLAAGPVLTVTRTAYDTNDIAVEVCEEVKVASAYLLEYHVPAR